MEQLIQFLLKNWYLVAIALTFIYQLNSRRQRTGRNTQQPGMPTFGQGPGEARRPAQAKRAQSGHMASNTRPERVRDEFNQSNMSKATPIAPKQKASPFTSTPTPSAAVLSSPIYVEEITSAPFPAQPTRDQVLQGVVWAEILGPPRAKKPFRK